MQIFGKYLEVMMAKYAENSTQNWRSKDSAMYLVTSLVSRGATQKHGVTQASQLVSVPQFCQQHVLPELDRPDGKFLFSLIFFCLYLKSFQYIF